METVQQNSKLTKRIIPITKWPEYHSWPPVGGLRHLVFYANENGFDSCIVRAGRRVLIDEEAFFQWVESLKKNPNQKGVSK